MNTFLSWDDSLGSTVFNLTGEDNNLSPARQDKEFLMVMAKKFTQNDSNSWAAPLSYCSPRAKLINNLQQAATGFSTLKCILERKPEMEN